MNHRIHVYPVSQKAVVNIVAPTLLDAMHQAQREGVMGVLKYEDLPLSDRFIIVPSEDVPEEDAEHIAFNLPGCEVPALDIRANGDFYVNGTLAATDQEVYEGLRDWLVALKTS